MSHLQTIDDQTGLAAFARSCCAQAIKQATIIVLLVAVLCSTGCARSFLRWPGGAQASTPIANPLFVPACDREFLWNQTVDAVDDYFRIEREERVRLVGGILSEGRIDTFPMVGSTIFEPWRVDSTRGYEKIHATLQSIRRQALVRVIPTEGGYLVDVAVKKELEDLDKPEASTAGGSTLRHDGSLVRQEGAASRYSVTLGWIPLGRDPTLEQRILADIAARLSVPAEIQSLPPIGVELPIEELPPGEYYEGAPSNQPEGVPQSQQRIPLELGPPIVPPTNLPSDEGEGSIDILPPP